jgi:hypothetical protein
MLPIRRQHFAETAFTTKTDCAFLFYDIRLRIFKDLLLYNNYEPSGQIRPPAGGRVLA